MTAVVLHRGSAPGGPGSLAGEASSGTWRRAYCMGLLSVVMAMLNADQNLLAPNVSGRCARPHQQAAMQRAHGMLAASPLSPLLRPPTHTRCTPMCVPMHGPQLTAAAKDFGLNPMQRDTYLGGYVMAAFFVVGAPSAVLVRRQAEGAHTRLHPRRRPHGPRQGLCDPGQAPGGRLLHVRAGLVRRSCAPSRRPVSLPHDPGPCPPPRPVVWLAV